MSTLINNIGSFVLSAITWLETFLGSLSGTYVDPENPGTTIFGFEPVLFIFVVALPLVGLGIGLLRRLIKTRG